MKTSQIMDLVLRDYLQRINEIRGDCAECFARQGSPGGMDFSATTFVPRTKRGLTDKVNDIKKTYRMICDFNATRLPGSTGRKPWFQEDEEYRQTVGRKIKCQLYSEECFDFWDTIYAEDHSAHPVSGIDLGLSDLVEDAALFLTSKIVSLSSQHITDNFDTGRKSKKRKAMAQEEIIESSCNRLLKIFEIMSKQELDQQRKMQEERLNFEEAQAVENRTILLKILEILK